jgi:hypothetical protein
VFASLRSNLSWFPSSQTLERKSNLTCFMDCKSLAGELWSPYIHTKIITAHANL